MYQLKNIQEILYSVGDLAKVKHFFCDYGGWDVVGKYKTDRSVLNFWDLGKQVSADEILIQMNNHPTGLMRLINFQNTEQKYIRSSQMAWDIGGIMDINLRVHNVKETFDEVRELGWHGLSDPLFQEMGPFKLYDILMKGYDDIIVAFTHRTQPPLELPKGFKIPSHLYNSSINVHDLSAARKFYAEGLGFKLLNEYSVVKDSPQENMFGLPFDLADKVSCKANIFSLDGERDVVFQTIEFEGVSGRDFSANAHPPNRGLLLYRCEVADIFSYYSKVQDSGIPINGKLERLLIEPYGPVNYFSVKSPEGVIWAFYEKIN